MVKKILLCTVMAVMTLCAQAELNLVVYHLTGEEAANELSKIGYVRLSNDSIYLYSDQYGLLGANRINEIRKITYEDREAPETSLSDEQQVSIQVYPNPTSDIINIVGTNGQTVHVFNLAGQLLLCEETNVGSTTINVASLPVGTYIIQIDTEIYKFIKK